MSVLDKQLARFSQECRRLDADRWRLALTNGASLTVSARRDEDFLLLDADPGLCPAPERLVPLLERSREVPAAVKFALRGSTAFRLRAEFPLPEEGGDAAPRIREHLEGMRDALHRLHDWVSCEAVGSEVACPKLESDGQAIPGSLTEALKEAGWEYHERPGGTLLADLETGSKFLQAEVEQCGVGTRFRVTLYRHESAGDASQQVLSLYLLEANAALRYARAFLRREGDGITAGFEVRTESGPSPAEAGHALAALSVAGRECAREMEVLKDGVVAGIYRSARLPFHPQQKGA
jgi:Putative bacterial sensory transduction regulator